MAEKSVGLIVMTEIPHMGLVAVLRERGNFNFEKMAPESWAGGCQVTVHGKLEEGEDFLDALDREINEELGPAFANISHLRKNIILVYEKQEELKHVKTFAQKLDCRCLARIRLNPDSGSIQFLPRHGLDRVCNLNNHPREISIANRSIIAMFPDEMKAVVKAFDVLK